MNITQLIKTDPEIEALSVLADAAMPMGARDIFARVTNFDDLPALAICLNKLRSEGLIDNATPQAQSMRYVITQSGRKKLAIAAMPPAAPVDYVKAATKSAKTEYEIPSFLNQQTPIVTASEWEPTTTAFLMLKAIQYYPGSTMGQIAILVGNKDAHEKYIPSYLKEGFVITGINEKNRKIYSLKEGMTAMDAYDWRGRRKISALGHLIEQVNRGIGPDISKDPLRTEANNPNKARFAYTSDRCLIITGLSSLPIEINQQDTQRLVEFISETITPVAVFEQ